VISIIPADGAGAENQQVKNRPLRITNRAQPLKAEATAGGTCQTVNDANERGRKT